jgi:hypothetical protein
LKSWIFQVFEAGNRALKPARPCVRSPRSRAWKICPITPAPTAISRQMVRFCRHACPSAPDQVVLDIDDTSDAVHGHQQLRLFNAFYDEYGSSSDSCSTGRVVFDGEGRLRRGGVAPGPSPQGGREFGTYSPLDPADPQTSAQDRNPAARRQQLLHATGSGSVRQALAAPCLRSGPEQPSVPEQPSGREQPASGGVVCSAVRAQFRAKAAPIQDLVLRSPVLVRTLPCRSTRSDTPGPTGSACPSSSRRPRSSRKKTRILVTLPASCPRQGLQHMLFDAPAPP